MTAQQYQESDLSTRLAELLREEPALIVALQVCDSVAPVNGGTVMDLPQPHHAAVQLGIDRGYALYPRVLKALAQKPKVPTPVEPTYEAPVEEKKEE